MIRAGIHPAPCRNFVKNYKMTTLNESRIVIVGGSSGIGLALTKMLAEEGACLTVIGRDPSKLSVLKKEFPAVETVQLDARDRGALDAFFGNAGQVDHLVLTVSGAKGGGVFRELPLAELREGFENKFWPQLNTVQAALPYMNPGGSITLVTAASAGNSIPGTSGLAALNGGLEMMVPILSIELKPLRVNAVSPGVIDTPWWDFLPAAARQQVFNDLSAQVNVGRVGRPEEAAAAIRFVMATGYVNGITLRCHGGLR